MPQTVPPTPDTALQNRIENKLEKSLGFQLNIQLQQQMGSSRLRSWFVYLGFYVAFNTVQVISRRVVGRAEETST